MTSARHALLDIGSVGLVGSHTKLTVFTYPRSASEEPGLRMGIKCVVQLIDQNPIIPGQLYPLLAIILRLLPVTILRRSANNRGRKFTDTTTGRQIGHRLIVGEEETGQDPTLLGIVV